MKSDPAQDGAHAARRVSAEHRRLDVFVGQWRVSGTNAPTTPGGAGSKVTGEESYEWMPGGFFLMNRWHRDFGAGNEHVGTGVIGHLPEAPLFFAQSFDNLGYERRYDVSAQGRVWSYVGPWERARLEFAEDAQSFTVKWEISRDGESWSPLCDLKMTKRGA